MKNLTKPPKLEVIKNNYAAREYNIHLEFPEFTCVCPKTSLPDFALITIDYVPDQTYVELKSLKLYFNFFRNVGIYHEQVVNKILDDLVSACHPRTATVKAEFNSRGGIKTTVVAKHPQ